MTDHPLSRSDVALVQDLFLTKIVMLRSGSADPGEWRFELAELERLSADTWKSRNAFLFDYTLARLIAVDATTSRETPTALAGSPSSIRDFVEAVASDDASAARDAWTSSPAVTDDRWGECLTASLIRVLSDRHDICSSVPELALLPPVHGDADGNPQLPA
jgi:hypothetical protein